MPRSKLLFVAAAVCAAGFAQPLRAQQTEPAQSGVVHVLGIEGVKRNAKGKISITGGNLRFIVGKAQSEIPLAQVDDVFTGDDSQRVVRGTLQALSTFAPYGGGRFLSLFRTKIDVLTIEYRDATGGRHGAILTLPDGKAIQVKKWMLAGGAKTSVPVEESEKKEEKKP